MRLSDFDFELPNESVARYPLSDRDASRLMVLDRRQGPLRHQRFSDLPNLLAPGDLLVLNDTRVLPARLRARKEESGGCVEILLVEPVESTGEREASSSRTWRAMVHASKPVRRGAALLLEAAPEVRIDVRKEEGEGFVVLEWPTDPREIAHRFGEIPLPPYLGRGAEPEDQDRYQTIFAKREAERSVAAPTAGLHFTPRLLEEVRRRGIAWTAITLHVGPGTFLPVRTEDVELHRMRPESYVVAAPAARAIEAAREGGGRVIAVGTTVTRVLETIGRPVREAAGSTSLFIRPGHAFRGIDALLTNFHLPRSTLLMLVSAFAGVETIRAAYREAVESGYRFFSYGDAMLIL